MLFLLRAAIEENAYNRMKKVVKWYISGFYKKPKVRSPTPSAIGHRFCICMNDTKIMFYGGFISTGVEEALQPHYWGDVPLHVAPSEDQ